MAYKICTFVICFCVNIFIIPLLLFLPHSESLNFSFSSFNPNIQGIQYENDSYSTNGVIQLTKNGLDSSLDSSVGRASYNKPVRLWDDKTGQLTNFSTHFSFEIKQVGNPNLYGDGLSFFLAPFNSMIPVNSTGGCLALVSGDSACTVPGKNHLVAVEFDTFHNSWDPSYDAGNFWDPNNDHVGIDVNSVVSMANVTWSGGLKNRSIGNAWVTYDSATHNLSVFLTYANNPVFVGNSSLWYIIDLRTVLPERVRVGFAAATGSNSELHTIFSWDFNSTLADTNDAEKVPEEAPQPGSPGKSKRGILVGAVVAGVGVVTIAMGLIGFTGWRRRSSQESDDMDPDVTGDFENGTGPKRFAYRELTRATNNFAKEGKLGEGGFGGVYLGLLTDSKTEIAVKKVSSGSRQGKKEYVSEVKIISRLRHRNLVQLLGWCHERGDLLLVYEYMPNGSLDSHLYWGKKEALSWKVRYKIALGLASAVVYLHEDWEQCVLHRDIKSSNVMLDSNFNAKLGDFGLARLVDHELGSQTTVLAGTLGYLAPECAITGKASKESDVYSFGVVALEIGCGRRPFEPREEDQAKVRMIEWVWDLYGKGLLLAAVDKRLEGEYDEDQAERLLMVGLWCCHPDNTLRPSISQVIKVVKSEAPLPVLPSTLPVPMYYSLTPMRTDICSAPSSSGFSGSSSGTTSASSQSHVSGTIPLLSEKADV